MSLQPNSPVGGDGSFLDQIFSGLKAKLLSNWLVAALLLAGFVGVIAFTRGWRPQLINGGNIGADGMAAIVISLTMAHLAVFLTMLNSFLESSSRKEQWNLDAVAPLVLVVLLSKGEKLFESRDVYIALTFLFVGLFIAAISINEFKASSAAGSGTRARLGSFMSRFDWTPLYVAGFYLWLLSKANWDTFPYPSNIPLWIVHFALVGGLIAETIKMRWWGVIVAFMGFWGGMTLEPLVMGLGVGTAGILTAILNQKGFVSHGSDRVQAVSRTVGGLPITFALRWDVTLIYLVMLFVTGITIYGNFVVWTP